jgi:hypothetical protein
MSGCRTSVLCSKPSACGIAGRRGRLARTRPVHARPPSLQAPAPSNARRPARLRAVRQRCEPSPGLVRARARRPGQAPTARPARPPTLVGEGIDRVKSMTCCAARACLSTLLPHSSSRHLQTILAWSEIVWITKLLRIAFEPRVGCQATLDFGPDRIGSK